MSKPVAELEALAVKAAELTHGLTVEDALTVLTDLAPKAVKRWNTVDCQSLAFRANAAGCGKLPLSPNLPADRLPRCERMDGSGLRIVPAYTEAGFFQEANAVTLTDGERTAVYVPADMGPLQRGG